ncbi:hypothetical protein [Micromonospora sp. HM5-17]|jgi:hypothetical protein|uniref:hypothetical protein n=1 Tax=Micromonospora sp. HM5-17 TaxID=2487710 RepID=UPI001315638E|nr:hypothetical protein [Micromonospora sp. HM5-17]
MLTWIWTRLRRDAVRDYRLTGGPQPVAGWTAVPDRPRRGARRWLRVPGADR